MASSRLRILFVAPYLPSRIRVRPYQIIRHLVQAGHEVTLVALADALPDAGQALAEMQNVCGGAERVHVVPHSRSRAAAQCALALPTPTPLWAAYCRSRSMAGLLARLTREQTFDVAHVEHLRAAHFAPALAPGLPRVMDAVDCITALRRQMLDQAGANGGGFASRLLAWEEWTKLRRYEPRAYNRFSQVVVTSPHDAGELKQLVNGHGDTLPPVHVIPNGVDLDYFSATDDDDQTAEPDTLVFSGKMSYHANDDAARFLLTEVMPRLRRLRPRARLTIVGSQPAPGLRALVEQTEAREYTTLTGYVDDLRPFLRRAQVAVCPMRIGVGIQNKALEAMAISRPVVCSPLVRRGLCAEGLNGALRIAETADQFAQSIAGLLARPGEARAAGAAARHYVEAHHRWARTAENMVSVYDAARRHDAAANRSEPVGRKAR